MEELKDFESASYQPPTVTPAQRYDSKVLVSIKAHLFYMAVRFGIPHQGELFFNFAGEVATAGGDPFQNPYLIAAPRKPERFTVTFEYVPGKGHNNRCLSQFTSPYTNIPYRVTCGEMPFACNIKVVKVEKLDA